MTRPSLIDQANACSAIPPDIQQILRNHDLTPTRNGQVFRERVWVNRNVSTLFGQFGTLRDQPLMVVVDQVPASPCPLTHHAALERLTTEASVLDEPTSGLFYWLDNPVPVDYNPLAPWHSMPEQAMSLWNTLRAVGVAVFWDPWCWQMDGSDDYGSCQTAFPRLLELAATHPQMLMSEQLVKELRSVPMWSYHTGRASSGPLNYRLRRFLNDLEAFEFLQTHLPQASVQGFLAMHSQRGDHQASSFLDLDITALPLDRVAQLRSELRCIIPWLQ